MNLDFAPILERLPLFWSGIVITITLAVNSTVFGLILGVFGAIARRSENAVLRSIAGTYVEVIRNTPLLIQIFLAYFGFSTLGFKFPAFLVATVALTINVGAYATEIIRAGLDSIPKGQVEAAEGLALTRPQIYWHIMLFPALEKIYPALTSQFILLMLTSSVASLISTEEVTAVANYVQSETYRAFETYIFLAFIYLVLAMLMRLGFWLVALAIFPRTRRNLLELLG